MATFADSTFARLPNSMSAEAEMLMLLDIRKNTENRLDRLMREIDPKFVPDLPLSGLRGTHPTVLLFKSGRNA